RYVNPDYPVIGQQKIDRILNEHYVESGAKELIKSKIKEKGEYTLLGQLQVRLDESRDHYWAEVPVLGSNFVRIGKKVLNEYGEVLLAGGAWGTMVVEYDPQYELKGRLYPFYVREFTPFQITRIALDDYVEKRQNFTTEEWIDLLIQSIGFNPAKVTEREKMVNAPSACSICGGQLQS
ncbi:ATP-dependent Lon protease, partial [Candidatus Hakubella thermalkaliphila]